MEASGSAPGLGHRMNRTPRPARISGAVYEPPYPPWPAEGVDQATVALIERVAFAPGRSKDRRTAGPSLRGSSCVTPARPLAGLTFPYVVGFGPTPREFHVKDPGTAPAHVVAELPCGGVIAAWSPCRRSGGSAAAVRC